MDAARRQRRSVERYSIAQRARGVWPSATGSTRRPSQMETVGPGRRPADWPWNGRSAPVRRHAPDDRIAQVARPSNVTLRSQGKGSMATPIVRRFFEASSFPVTSILVHIVCTRLNHIRVGIADHQMQPFNDHLRAISEKQVVVFNFELVKPIRCRGIPRHQT
jgi:hypothetical protein